MDVIAGNIANVNTTRVAGRRGPFRRREVVFESAARRGEPGGVRLAEIVEDPSPFITVHRPGHPDADPSGRLLIPNVNLAVEMMDLIAASRGYEANLRAIRSYLSVANEVLQLGR